MNGNDTRKLVERKDLILVLICVLISIVMGTYFFISNKSQGENTKIAIIKYDNKEIYRIDLNSVEEPYCVPIEHEYHSKIFVEKGKICFKDADCPDRVCVNTGKISNPGQIAVCVPAKLIIEIRGEESSDKPDATTG